MQEIAEGKLGKPPKCVVLAGETPGGKIKPVRRTRGLAPLDPGDANGQTSNGHVTRGAENGGASVNGHGRRSIHRGSAASDDASGTPAAMAANSAAAGTDRDAIAEVAKPRKTRKTKKGANKAGPRDTGESGELVEMPPGTEALPEDGVSFVDAIHEHIDLWEVGKRQMQAKDEKIAQRAWERMLEMKYGKGPAAAVDEAPQIIFDTPRPVRD